VIKAAMASASLMKLQRLAAGPVRPFVPVPAAMKSHKKTERPVDPIDHKDTLGN
jgi:hypothetical protein